MSDDRRHDLQPGGAGEDPDGLGHIETLLRELDATDLEPIAPPSSVWEGIERRLGDEGGGPAASGAPDGPRGTGQVVPISSRRRTTPIYLAAAAAVILLVVGAVAVMSTGDDVTEVRLAYDPDSFDPLGADASALARLVAVDGGYAIELDDTALPSVEAADLELWLLEKDAAGVVVAIEAVALLDGSDRYEVPAGLDVSTHRTVDISIEPRDGDETHSGRSILRGDFPDA